LADTAAVTAIVSTRIWEITLPENPVVPAIRVQIISEPLTYHLRGPNGLRRSRVQVDAYVSERAVSSVDDPGANANALADAIDTCLSGATFSAGGSPAEIEVTGVFRQDRRVLREPDELRYLRVMQDYIVWSKPAS